METYFTGADATVSSFFETRVQHDGNSCGAWLVAGIVACILGGGPDCDRNLTREKCFSVLMTLVENIDTAEKVKLAKIILSVSIDDENDDHFPNISKTAKRSGKRYIIDDSFDEKGDQDGVQVPSAFNEEKYKDFVSNVKVYSSPAKKPKTFLRQLRQG